MLYVMLYSLYYRYESGIFYTQNRIESSKHFFIPSRPTPSLINLQIREKKYDFHN
jgi:hypothetical protein